MVKSPRSRGRTLRAEHILARTPCPYYGTSLRTEGFCYNVDTSGSRGDADWPVTFQKMAFLLIITSSRRYALGDVEDRTPCGARRDRREAHGHQPFMGDVCMWSREEGARMTADTACERQEAIRERRAAYEMEVVHALLDESAEERAERLELVRRAQAMLVRVFQLAEEPLEN